MLPNPIRYIREKIINKGYKADYCEICHQNFSVLKLKKIHKCKRCERFICLSCGTQRAVIINPEFEQNYKQPGKYHRICDICANEKQLFRTLYSIEKLQWNQHSQIGYGWLSSFDTYKKQYGKNIDSSTYIEYLKYCEYNSDLFIEDILVIRKDITEGRTDYLVFNYSLMEFLSTVYRHTKTQESRQNLCELFYALLVRYPNFGYCQGMNYIGAYLLCFTENIYAFYLFEHLVEHILPPHFYQKNGKGTGLIGYQAESYVIKKLAEETFLIEGSSEEEKSDYYSVLRYCEMICPQYLLTLMVNNLNANCVYYIWNELFTLHTFEVFERAFIAVLKINYYLISENITCSDLKELVFKNTSYEKLSHYMKELYIYQYKNTEKAEEKRYRYFAEYMLQFSLQWCEPSQSVWRQLSRITDFSYEEISGLYKGFSEFVAAYKTHNQPGIKYGISKKQCLTLIEQFAYQYAKSNKKDFIELKQEDYLNLFSLFIEFEEQVLDFREFVCCLSLLTRGTLKKKLEVFFTLFDLNNKHYLSEYEFIVLLETLILSMKMVREDEALTQYASVYINKLRENTKNAYRITLTQLVLHLSDPFILELSAMYASLTRKNTCVVVANYLRGIYSGTEQKNFNY